MFKSRTGITMGYVLFVVVLRTSCSQPRRQQCQMARWPAGYSRRDQNLHRRSFPKGIQDSFDCSCSRRLVTKECSWNTNNSAIEQSQTHILLNMSLSRRRSIGRCQRLSRVLVLSHANNLSCLIRTNTKVRASILARAVSLRESIGHSRGAQKGQAKV